ncbi:hypothetical protein [Maritimibacter sp. DP1N21-5]|uniref:hypothetical protein n=1 Tax=Maritimibacter sp. DP1N21-5 TaxID=2836867 RepID=UPI001C49061B|nr:hypothetical protein [Maritimibacter sp. DP1N21-5]MBV7408742.1 hypothetical protein [Maritimibacter sp. DP1N21-5]
MPKQTPLMNITADDLRPLWSRLDIPTERIAAALGVTRAGLSWKAKALGLSPRTGNRESTKRVDDQTFTRMWLAGVSTQDMATFCGYRRAHTVTCRRRALGLPARKRGRSGQKGGWLSTISAAEYHEMEIGRLMAAERARHG